MSFFTPEVINIIMGAAREDKLVVFVGAGASKGMRLPNGTELPDWPVLIRKLIDSIDRSERFNEAEKKYIKEQSGNNFSQILDYLCGRDKPNFQAAFWEIFPPHMNMYKSTKVTQLIMQLKTKRFVTTNYDYCLEITTDELNRTKAGSMGYKDIDIERFKNENGTLIIHIHGMASNKIDDIILTELQYAEAYDNDSSNLVKLLEYLFVEFTVLFIGFSFDDQDIRRFLTKYSVYGRRTLPHHHYVVFKKDNPDQERFIKEVMLNNYNLKTIFYDLTGSGEDEHALLLSLLKEIIDLSKEPGKYVEESDEMSIPSTI